MFGTPEAKFRITAQDKSKKELDSVKKNLGAVNKGFNAIGISIGTLLSAGGIVRLTTQLVDMGSRLTDVATRIDATVEGVQALELLAIKSGTPIEKLEPASSAMRTRFEEAQRSPFGDTARAFLNLGVKSGYFADQGTEGMLEQLASGYVAARDINPNMADWSMQKIFGEDAGRFMKEPLERLHTAGWEGLKDLPGIMSDAAAQWADQNADDLALTFQMSKGDLGERAYRSSRNPGGALGSFFRAAIFGGNAPQPMRGEMNEALGDHMWNNYFPTPAGPGRGGGTAISGSSPTVKLDDDTIRKLQGPRRGSGTGVFRPGT